MDFIAILITGHESDYVSSAWLKEELQKHLDHVQSIRGLALRVKMVEITSVDHDGGVHRAQTKAG